MTAAHALCRKKCTTSGWQNSWHALLVATPLFNHATGLLTKTGVAVKGRSGQTLTLLKDGRVLIAGGVTDVPFEYSATAEVYDPATGSFTAVGSMDVLRRRQHEHRSIFA